jgi:hypothetical protein
MDRLDGMRLFARVVETGSFSEGARQEGVGQSTVSKITTLPRSLTLVSTMTRLPDSIFYCSMPEWSAARSACSLRRASRRLRPLIGHHQRPVAAHRYLQASEFGTDVSGQFFASAPKKFTCPIEAMRHPHFHDRANQEAAWQAVVNVSGVDLSYPASLSAVS